MNELTDKLCKAGVRWVCALAALVPLILIVAYFYFIY